MSISITCPACKRRMNAPATAAGKQAKCPKCGQQITVPPPPAAIILPSGPGAAPAIPVAQPLAVKAEPPEQLDEPEEVSPEADAWYYARGKQPIPRPSPTGIPMTTTFSKRCPEKSPNGEFFPEKESGRETCAGACPQRKGAAVETLFKVWAGSVLVEVRRSGDGRPDTLVAWDHGVEPPRLVVEVELEKEHPRAWTAEEILRNEG